jgi:hypothetical protein
MVVVLYSNPYSSLVAKLGLSNEANGTSMLGRSVLGDHFTSRAYGHLSSDFFRAGTCRGFSFGCETTHLVFLFISFDGVYW